MRWMQVCALRESYADLLENDDEFSEAAKVLIGIPLESGNRCAPLCEPLHPS